ncbi:MAG: hypothetical protein J7621_20705 [Niastella sp.]|nr:hypothetical protein [Niastella sp.]
MANNNFSATVLLETGYLLSPVKSLHSGERVVAFFKKLGYDLPQVNVLSVLSSLANEVDGVITGASALVNATTDSERQAAIAALVPKVGSTFAEVSNLVTAINGLAGYSAANNPPLSELPKRFIDYLIFQYLYQRQPRIFGIFYLLGILDEANEILVIHWDRLPRYFTEPAAVFNEMYSWSTSFNTDVFLGRFQLFLKAMGIAGGIYKQSTIVKNALGNTTADLSELRIPVLQKGYYPELYAQLGINLSPAEAKANALKGIALIPYFRGTSQFDFEISKKWMAVFTSQLTLDAGVGLVIRPPFNVEIFERIFSAPLEAGSFELDLTVKQKPDQNNQSPVMYLFGSEGDTHMSIKGIAAKFFVSSGAGGQDIGLEIDFEKIKLQVGGGAGDSFLNKMLPEDGISASVGFGLGFSLKRKFYFKGSSGIEILLPVQLKLGPVEIQNILVGVSIENNKIPISVGADVKAELGPLVVVVQNIGLKTNLTFADNGGNMGPVNASFDFKFPDAIGLSIDTSVVKAGGFLSIKPNEYIGALELEIKSFNLAIKAIAIINTNLPDGSFSLLVIITAEFNPIQLGYGFSLNGLGGLFGYKRSFQADELRLGLKTKALDSILFPKDVIANIGRIVGDLKRVFPIGNNFLIGPMIKIGWGTTLVTAEIGVLIQVPEPVIIAILGIIRLQLPDPKEPVLLLQINFLGVIDFEKKMFSLDASLSDSRILIMTITGDFALRIGWGSPATFIFSSGGFHPDFKEAPVELQHMERLGIQVINEESIKLGIDAYFALTTNTVQIGARARFWAQSGGYTAVAEVGFDALIQFDPFFFTVAIYLTGRVTGPFIDIGIDVRGNLSGPNQWHVWGYAKASIIGFSIEIPFDETFGDPIEELSAGLQKVLDILKEEIPKSSNWKPITVVTGPPKISLRENKTGPDDMLIHPNTTLSFNQRAVPLKTNIEKFGNKGIDGDRQYALSAFLPGLGLGLGGTPLYDLFAPGQFFNIPKSQQLSRPSFERFESGQSFSINTSSAANGIAVSKVIDYEVVYIRRKKPAPGGVMNLLGAQMVVLLADSGAAAKSKFSLEKNRPSYQAPPVIGINRPAYVVVNSRDLSPVGTETFSNQTAAYNEQQVHGVQGTVVLSTHEL